MFGFGHGPELIIILVIALIVLGPGKIPEVAHMLGKGIRELRQASSELQRTFDVNELMNPTPSTPPPAAAPADVEPVPVAATSETILPPAASEAPAKPRRARKPRTPAALDMGEPVEAETAARPRARRARKPGADVGSASIGEPALALTAAEPAVPEATARPRRRPSKKTTEPVSLDASA